MEENDRSLLPKECLNYSRSWFLLPDPEDYENIPRSFYIRIILLYAIAIIPVGTILLHLTEYNNTPVEVLFFEISLLSIGIPTFLIMCIYLIKLPKICKLIVEGAYFIQDVKELEKLKEKQMKIIKAVRYVVTLPTLGFAIWRSSLYKTCMEKFHYKDHANYCKTVIPVLLPFDADYFLIRYTINIFQTMTILVLIHGLDSGFCLCVCSMQNLILGQQQLVKYVQHVAWGQPMIYYKEYLRRFINMRNKIQRFAAALDDITCYVNFIHIMCSSIIFTFVTVDIFVNGNLISVLNLVGWFITLAYISKLGQDVISESENLYIEIYNLPWYEMKAGLRHDILFILMASQKPLYLRVGPFAILYGYTFLKMLQGASSYITMVIDLS